jgi:predicted membrane-bound spermidine synthase
MPWRGPPGGRAQRLDVNRIPVAAFFALFTVSGFAGLIYESIWSHYLKLFLGHAAYAQTLVLAIFMGGMALGSWLVSRFTLRIPDLLRGYAIAELGIGILAIVFHPVFKASTGWALDSLFPALGAGASIDVAKWTLASALILPASLLLGTTFPLMSAGVMRVYPETGGRALAMLYFTNSFGAAVGVLASGFLLITRVGLPGTILAAGLMNVVLALVVWMITRHLPRAEPRPPTPGVAAGPGSRGLGRVVMVAALATGAASFVYEITWIRMLSTGLGASTHAFEIMLSAFILGMSLGALALRWGIERLKNDVAWLAAILFAKAFFAAYAVWVYGDVLEFVRWTLAATARTDEGYAIVNVAGLAASMIVMLPTAFCAGMTLPLATHALTRRGHGEASIGRVYGANTAGCILGAAFTTHVGMELLGVKNLTGLGAFIDVGVGVAILAVGLEGATRSRALAASAVLCVAGAIAFATIELDLLRMSSGVFRFGVFEDPARSSVVFYRDGKTASISVTDHMSNNRRAIRTNGKVDASINVGEAVQPGPDEGTMILAAAIPLALKPEAQLVANIGFGSGLTTHALLGSSRVREVDSIEIERMMVEGARLFHPRNRRAYEDPRSRIHIDDAKTFFASRARRYDIIVSEPSNPWVSGVSTLFSQEFYAQIRRHIADDGLLVQWIQSYDIGVDLLATVFKALGASFGDYVVYRVGAVDLLIVATPGKSLPPMRPDLFSQPGIAEDLAYLGYHEVADLAGLRIAGRRALEGVFARSDFPTNSDYFPILDQYAPLARFRGDSAQDLRSSREHLVPVLAMLDEDVRIPVARVRRAGAHPPAHVARARIATEAIGILLGGQADAARVLPAQDQAAALLVHGLLGGCAEAQAQFANAVHQVMGLAMPVLDGKDLDIAFQAILGSPCGRSLRDFERARIDLLKAMNDRDAEAMRRIGEQLLAFGGPELDRARPVWLMAALAGHVAAGDAQRAGALWKAHEPHLTAAGRALFPMRVLQARALDAR